MAADDIPQVRRRLRRLHEDADMVHRRIVMLTVAGDHTPIVMLLSIIPGEAPTGSNQAWTEIHESVDQQLAQHPPIAENG